VYGSDSFSPELIQQTNKKKREDHILSVNKLLGKKLKHDFMREKSTKPLSTKIIHLLLLLLLHSWVSSNGGTDSLIVSVTEISTIS